MNRNFIKKLIKFFKPTIARVLILLILYLTMGWAFLSTNMSGGLLFIGDLVFIFVTFALSDHFDTYKSKKYKNQFIITIIFAIILIMILSIILASLDIDISTFKGFKSISFNLYILLGAYILSLFYKEIKYFFDTRAKK